jgi:hypothetical protein
VVQGADGVAAPARSVEISEANGGSLRMNAAQLEWMQSPIARDLMSSHQRDWVRRSSEDLFTLLELSPEQTEALIALMVDPQTAPFDGFTPGTSIDPATLESVRNKVQEQRRKADESIKELLGEEKYRTYQDYRNTEMERAQLAELRRLFETTPTPLRAEQSAELLAALIEERTTVPHWTRKPYTPTEEELQDYQQWAEDYQLRVQERIASLLSHEQLERYNAFQRMQAAMRHEQVSEGVVIQDGIAFSTSAVAIPE